MLENIVKERMKQGKPSVGLISNLASHHLTEIFGISGFDFIIFDMEHSTISEETLEGLVRTAKLKGLVPMARVRENNSRLVLGVLDAGCLGVMIPQVESKEEAREAVESTKYRPIGKRGINWKTVAGEWGTVDPAKYLKAANDSILTLIQIETVKGFENVEEIVKVEGIDAILIGPSDLSGSMGYPGNPGHEDVKKAIDKIIKVTKDAGIVSGGAASANKEMMAEAQKNGVLLFTVNPAGFLTESFKQLLSGIKDTFIS
jgi:4-hydroxy-2-oxoheptanedioate aldolase